MHYTLWRYRISCGIFLTGMIITPCIYAENSPDAAASSTADSAPKPAVEQSIPPTMQATTASQPTAEPASTPEAEESTTADKADNTHPSQPVRPTGTAVTDGNPQANMPYAYPPRIDIRARQAAYEQSRARRKARQERWEARRAELDAYYQDLRRRAAESDIYLPRNAPWEDAKSNGDTTGSNNPSAPRGASASPPTPEQQEPPGEQDASQAELARMQAIIDAMTPEEREVCTTVHRLSMGLMRHPEPSPPPPEYAQGYSGPPPAYGYGYAPGYGGPRYPSEGQGYYPSPDRYGPPPGYGYGPRPNPETGCTGYNCGRGMGYPYAPHY